MFQIHILHNSTYSLHLENSLCDRQIVLFGFIRTTSIIVFNLTHRLAPQKLITVYIAICKF